MYQQTSDYLLNGARKQHLIIYDNIACKKNRQSCKQFVGMNLCLPKKMLISCL